MPARSEIGLDCGRIDPVICGRKLPAMRLLGVLPLLLFLILLAMLSFVFGQVFTSALIKLKLEPATALLVVVDIFMGSAINIPVKRISRRESVSADPLAVFGLSGWWPALQRVRRENVIAVNVGGCLIPIALALYEAGHLMAAWWQPVAGLSVAIFINTALIGWRNRFRGSALRSQNSFLPCLQPYALCPSPRTKPLRSPLSPACSARSSRRTCSISAISKRSPPASAGRVHSMGLCFPESSRLIWRDSIRNFLELLCALPPGQTLTPSRKLRLF
jgi:Protein of unknown function (DUF1614)